MKGSKILLRYKLHRPLYFIFVFSITAVSLWFLAALSAYATPAQFTLSADPWLQSDVGHVSIAGSVDDATSVITVTASGKGVWGNEDGFHYVYQPLNGDGEIIAYVGAPANTSAWAVSGLMLRESLTGDAPHVMARLRYNGSLGTAYRLAAGASTQQTNGGIVTSPRWLRLARMGDTVTTYHSDDGLNWDLLETVTVSMNQNVYIGLAVTAFNNTAVTTATFTDITVISSNPPPTPAPTNTPEPPPVVLCGDDELPTWGICLYGAVWWQPATGTAVPLTNVPITVSKGISQVTGITQIYTDQAAPTYAVDISPLDLDFLQPITITANVNGTTVTQQIIVYPDFSTQSQQADLIVSELGSLNNDLIWGSVIDFPSGGPVTGATITAARNGQQVTVTTTQSMDLPTYTFSQSELAQIGVGFGDMVTLTAQFGADKDQRVITLSNEPAQMNFVTGWKCDDFNPLPDPGSGSFRDEAPPGGGPDVTCFWGYGRFAGQPKAGIQVQLEVDGAIYEGQTRLYPSETFPRYGIGVWGAHIIEGQVVTATGVYSGHTTSEVTTVTLDVDLHQRIDLGLAEATLLNEFSMANDINALAWDGTYLWSGTTGGVVRWDPTDGSHQLFTTADGLISNNIEAIAVDIDGTIWFGTPDGVTQHTPGGSPEWETLTSQNTQAIAVGKDGSLWLGWAHGISHYIPGANPQWENLTTSDGLIHDYVTTIAVANDGSLWFGSREGVSHYTPDSNPAWENFTVADGLIHNTVQSIAAAADGSLWFATNGGVSHYTPGTNPTWESFTTADGLAYRIVQTVAVASDDSLWFGTGFGITHYVPGSNPDWETFTFAEGMVGNNIRTIAVGSDENIWFGTGERGISHYIASNNPQWEAFVLDNNSLPGNSILSMAVGQNEAFWFGLQGEGVARYILGGNPEWQTFTTADGLAHNSVMATTIAADNSLWFGTGGGVSHYTPGGSPEWQTFTTADGLAHNSVVAVVVAADNSLWFGTSGGVSHYTPGGSPEWQTFTTADGLGANTVFDILIDKDNSLWFGTRLGGVSHYTPESSPEWETFTPSDGLASVTVRSIARGSDDSLWFGTSDGVSRYNPIDNPAWKTYTTADGLAGNNVSVVGIGLDETLWVGTIAGLTQLAVPLFQSDLSVGIKSKGTALAGTTLTYTLQVDNHGQASAIDTMLTLTLPEGTVYASSLLTPVSTSPPIWALPEIAPGSGITTSVVVTLSDDLSNTVHTAVVEAFTATSESFLSNNTATIDTHLIDPNYADVGVTLSGPPLLVPGHQANYTLFIDNKGGAVAANTRLIMTLPPELTFVSAGVTPTTFLEWDWNTLLAQSSPLALPVTLSAESTVPVGTVLSVTAVLTTTTPDNHLTNNSTSVTTPISPADATTLILVAPDRLIEYYGTSAVMEKLYELAQHPLVNGVVLDVMTDSNVAMAYANWEANPGSYQRANEVATGIKILLDDYTLAYPGLQYLVLVGGDPIIPFYRVADRNGTAWYEQIYGSYVPAGTAVRAALSQDQLLTDDFYAARNPILPDSPFWYGDHPLYLPDLAIGRLVETPAEIITAVDAFLANDGQMMLATGTVGSDAQLAADLSQAQCDVLNTANIASLTCTDDTDTFTDAVLAQTTGSIWAAFHSSHFSIGSLKAVDIQSQPQAYDQTLLITIGCHAGLPVPDGSGLITDLDLPQAFLGQGGTYIGSNAYTYGSYVGVSYSEDLALVLTKLVSEGNQTIGHSLVQAKHTYYAEREMWVDRLDEKVLIPLTLYGLPMLRLATP